MRFDDRFLDELRVRINVQDIVARRVKLARRGRDAIGLCPFHNEKSPSFHAYEDHYHCFGCGAHGDVIRFVMQTEGATFPDAVERLAREAGLALPAATRADALQAQKRQTLFSLTNFAAVYFAEQLDRNRAAQEYLLGRGVERPMWKHFGLGFAPQGRQGLRQAVLRGGLSEALAIEAGLLVRSEEGENYDRFRGRIMFTIADRQGRAIAFGGRILGPGEPKYLNSPETPLFQKGRELYGLPWAMKPAQERRQLIVCEGYMDVIALHKAGFTNSVAPLGTALTEDQLTLLWRYVAEPLLCFDGDAAGEKAAMRAALRALPLLRPGKSLSVVWLPSGEDPDSLLRARGAGGMEEAVARAQPLADFLWSSLTARADMTTPERRAGFRKDVGEMIQTIADRDVRAAYQADYAQRLAALWSLPSALSRRVTASRGGRAARRGTERLVEGRFTALLLAALHNPFLLERHGESLAQLSCPDPELDKFRQRLLDLSATPENLDSARLASHMREEGFGPLLANLIRGNLLSFAAPDASPERAERGFVHILALFQKNIFDNQDLRETASFLDKDLSVRNWTRFKARYEGVTADFQKHSDLASPNKMVMHSRKKNGEQGE
ncbi:MAG TPA: DNA primase [Dongiaceae bacterium]|jgi:DNA primase|nr:DNA primase [Dongiaceae bacterium]